MKVLFLNLLDDPAEGGGAEMTLHHLTQGLVRRGMEPVFAAIGERPGLHRSESEGVRIWRAGLHNLYRPDLKARPHPAARALCHALDSYNALMQPLLRRVLETERPDVASIYNLPGWSAAAGAPWRTWAVLPCSCCTAAIRSASGQPCIRRGGIAQASAAISVGLNRLLIPSFGIVGAALANLVGLAS